MQLAIQTDLKKEVLIKKLDELFPNEDWKKDISERAEISTQAVRDWIAIPSRSSKRIQKHAVEKIEEGEAAARAILRIKALRRKT